MLTCKLTKKTLSHIILHAFAFILSGFTRPLFPKRLWNCVSPIPFRKCKREVVIYLFNYDLSKSTFFMVNMALDVLFSSVFVKWIGSQTKNSFLAMKRLQEHPALCFSNNVIVLHHGYNNFLFYFGICVKFTLSAVISLDVCYEITVTKKSCENMLHSKTIPS